MPLHLFFEESRDSLNLSMDYLHQNVRSWQTDPFKMGNNFHKSPKLLVKKCKTSFPPLMDLQMKSPIFTKNPRVFSQ